MACRGRAALLAAAVALAGCGGSGEPPLRQVGQTVTTASGIARKYGRGTSAVWVLTPRVARPRSVVVFVHGWTATLPFEWHEAWFDHLLARGSAVVFPVYQLTGDEDELVVAPLTLRAGVQAGFRALGRPHVPVVVAGFSVGGALAFYYAADARGWGVPPPAAVYSIFPIDPIRMDPGLTRLGPPPRVPTLVLAADEDQVVGRTGADAFWRWLAPVPQRLKTYRLLHSSRTGLFFDHDSPTAVYDPRIRAVFWPPLDRLVADARLRPNGT